MDNIISFPTKEVRDKATIERSIRNILPGKGYSQNVVDTTIKNMNAFLDILCTDIQLSFQVGDPRIADSANAFQIALNDRNYRLVIERLNAEIDRCYEIGIK